MENHNSKDNRKLRRIFRLRWIWIIVGCGVLAALILISMPFGVDYAIERYFLTHGADEADVADVDFNPFTRRLVLKNVTVKVANEQVLNVSKAGFTIAWSPFFKKRFLIEKIDLSDSIIIIEEMPEGRWRIGGLLPEPSADRTTASAWGFGLAELQIKNSQVKFRSPQLTSELQIEQARLSRLRSWLPDQKTRMEFKGQLNDGKLQFQGDFSPFGSGTAVDGSVKLNGLTLTPFAQLIAADPNTLQGRLDADVGIQGKFSSAKGFGFDQTGRLALNQARMRFGDVDLADEHFTWDGTFQVKLPAASDALQIAVAGQLEGQGGSVNPVPENVNLQHSGLKWNGKFALTRKPETSELKVDGALKLQNFKMAASSVNLTEENLTWNGSLQIFLPESGEPQRLTTNGKLESRHQRIGFLQKNLNLANENLLWQGRFNCGLKDFKAGLAAEGDFSLTDLAMTARHNKLRLLASKAVNIKAIKGDADSQFSVATAKITGLDLIGKTGSPENASLFSASEVTVDSVKLERLKQVSIESVRIVAAKGVLHHKSDGRWLYIDDLTAFLADSGSNSQRKPSQNSVTEETRPPAKEAGIQSGIRIGILEIVGDSRLHFEDETVSPTFNTDMDLKEARLTGVNSFQPEQSSPFALEASSRKYTRLKLQGNVQPFRERFSMDLKGKVKAAEMPPLSPYAVKTLGYNLISGEMDADIDLKIIMGKLEGEGDLKFYNPQIEAVDPEKFKNEAGKAIPLQSALEVLRDNDNDVRLKIPISGDVTDPKFSFSDAINQALIKGLSTAALSYLKYMLGPYGMAIGIIELAVKVGAKALPGIRLEPVEFQPGASDLDPATMDYLDKVAAILKGKKDLRLRLCGWAIEGDRMGQGEAPPKPTAPSGSEPLETKSAPGGEIDAQKEPRFPVTDAALLQLAEQRADRIEDILVSQHGIKNKRIFICQPQIDKDPAAQPRVELVF
jgi:hypothetical protein